MSFLKTPLCSLFGHGVATQISEAGFKRRWEVCHHVLGKNLHSFCLKPVFLQESLRANYSSCTSVSCGSGHPKGDWITQHGLGCYGVHIRCFLEGSFWVVLPLYPIFIGYSGQIIDSQL